MPKATCEAPKCTIKNGLKTCPSMTPNYGGVGCRERNKSEFEPKSLFYKQSGKSRILIGCLKGQYDEKARRCRRGTRAVLSETPV